MRISPSVIVLGSCLLGLAAGASAAANKPEPGTVIAAGDIRSRHAFYSVVFYFSPKPAVPAVATVREMVAASFPGLTLVTDPKEAPKPPFIALETEAAPLENFPVPPADYLERHGYGVTSGSAAAVQETAEAIKLLLVAPKDQVWDLTRRFTELILAYAEKTGALVWDSSTRQAFSPAAWKERRLDPWQDPIPGLPDHYTIHAYRVEETNYVRAITLGLEKFALPDLVIQQLLASETRPGGNLINITAQLLAENPVVTTPDRHRVSQVELKNEALRTSNRVNLLKGATEETRLALVVGRPEEGDPDNRLVELDFRNGEGRSTDERRQAVFDQMWGSTESLVNVKHDAEILEASQRAKQRLPDLQRRFAKGLAPGERIILKAPFARDDEGNEWMWVEVLKWPESGKISGILQNDPFYIKKLRSGSRVLIKPEEVFDYVYYKADGSEEGNETGRIMLKRNPEPVIK